MSEENQRVWGQFQIPPGPDLLAELGEPLPDVPNDYREAALHFCRIMFCVDEFATESIDTRLAIVSIAVTLRWPSVRGLSIG